MPSVESLNSDPLLGAYFSGRFRVICRIGDGGMGTVYRAHDALARSDVAIKVLKPHLAERTDLLKRFEREARAMLELDHPNVVRLLDYGADAATGSWFIVMELLEGTPLNVRVQKQGPLSPERAIHIGSRLCSALQEAHERGIVHRDLKPENIILCGDNDEPRLIDFGLAKLEQPLVRPGSVVLTQEGMVFGTPEFMSPEQARGRTLDRRSDVYSLAVILYEALTGKLPFEAKTPMEFVRGHVLETPIRLSVRAPERAFPAGLEQVLSKAMAKKRSDRYQSAAAFEAGLVRVFHRAAAGGPAETRKTGRSRTFSAQRAMVVTLALALTMLLTWALVLYTRTG